MSTRLVSNNFFFLLQITILLRMFCLGSQRSRLISITEYWRWFALHSQRKDYSSHFHIFTTQLPLDLLSTQMEKRLYENLTEKPGDPVLPRRGGAPEWGEDFEEGGRGAQARSKGSPSCPQAVSEIRRARLPSWNLPTLELVSVVNICVKSQGTVRLPF